MANTAATQLVDDIEALRREAFAAGYAAAMKALREFTLKPAPNAGARAPRQRRQVAMVPPSSPLRAARQPRGRTAAAPQRTSSPRPRRGTNAQIVEEVLRSLAPRALRQAEIRSAIERDRGTALSFASIRHSLGQLERRGAVEQIANSNTWRHVS